MDSTCITIEQLTFSYPKSDEFSFFIDQFTLLKGETVFIEGDSGSGKTTFLNLLTGLLTCQTGRINVLGTEVHLLSRLELDRFRARHFGIISQLFNLVSYLSGLDNILLPTLFNQHFRATKDMALQLCSELDITEDVFNRLASDLSIGQQQRLAIARALISNPDIIIADEPTSALDSKRKQQFVDLLFSQCRQRQCSLLFVSHDISLRPHFDRHVVVSNGSLMERT